MYLVHQSINLWKVNQSAGRNSKPSRRTVRFRFYFSRDILFPIKDLRSNKFTTQVVMLEVKVVVQLDTLPGETP